MGLSDAARKYHELKKKKTELNNNLKEINKKMAQAEEELIEELSHEGMSRLDLAGEASFSITERRFYKVTDREAFMDFLHDQGDTDLLGVQHQTLNAYAKEMQARKESAGEEDFNIPGVSYVTKTQIRVRKI